MVWNFRDKIVKGGQEAFRARVRKSRIVDARPETQYLARKAREGKKLYRTCLETCPLAWCREAISGGTEKSGIHETRGFPGARHKQAYICSLQIRITSSPRLRMHDIRHVLHYRSCERRSRATISYSSDIRRWSAPYCRGINLDRVCLVLIPILRRNHLVTNRITR